MWDNDHIGKDAAYPRLARQSSVRGAACSSSVQTSIAETERLQFARTLHDGLVQNLIAHSYDLASLGRAEESQAPRLRENVLDLLSEVRELISTLRPAPLGGDADLQSAVKGYYERLKRSEPAGPLLKLEVDKTAMPEPHKQHVYRVVQEALRNSFAHAEAAHVQVELRQIEACYELSVRDDGKGFSAAELRTYQAHNQFGLVLIHERAALLGADVKLDAEPGKGTCLQLSWPISLRKGERRG